MAHCQIPRSFRNRVLIALLPFARLVFWLQDAIYRRLGLRPRERTTPPNVPVHIAAPFAPEHGYLTDRCGCRLFYRLWPPSGAPARGLVIAFDGLGSDARQFHPVGPSLAERGIAFIGLDLPGHGLSEGLRGSLSTLIQQIDGVGDALAFFGARFPKVPAYLLAESIGAPLALQLAGRRERPANLAGLILASPEVEPTRFAPGGPWAAFGEVLRQIPFLLFWSHAPSVDLAGREKLVARGIEVYEHSVRDPLRNNRVSVRTMVRAFELVLATPIWARRVRLPTLVLAASCDQVTRPEAAAALLGCLGTGDKELVYFAGAAHGLFYDPDTPEVIEVIAHWLERQIGRGEAPARRHAA